MAPPPPELRPGGRDYAWGNVTRPYRLYPKRTSATTRTPMRIDAIRKRWLTAIRNSTAARKTVRRTYSSPFSRAPFPASSAEEALVSRASATSDSLTWYWDMKDGPGGVPGLRNGFSAIHASKATRYSGRKRASYRLASWTSPLTVASSQKL